MAAPPQATYWVISLEDALERRAHISDQFARRGVDFEFFNAIDARTMNLTSTPYVPHAGTRWTLSRSEVAVFESHRALWTMCVEHSMDYMFVFEDDVVLAKTFRDACEMLVAQGLDFDVIKLDWHPLKTSIADPKDIAPGFQLGWIARTMPSAAAYVISRNGARKLLRWGATYCDHLDDFVFMPRRNWKLFQLLPPVAVQAYMIEDVKDDALAATVRSGQRTGRTGVSEQPEKPPASFRVKREIGKAIHKTAVFWQSLGRRRNVRVGTLPLDLSAME